MPPIKKHSTVAYSLSKCATEADRSDLRFTKNQIFKNFSVMCIAWWIFFALYNCLIMLQSTLNSKAGIGVISIAVHFGGGMFVSLLFTNYLIKKLGCKLVTLLSIVFHIPYIAANFYPHWILMILSSIFVSVGSPLIWASMCAYLKDLAVLYANITAKHDWEDEDDQNTLNGDDSGFNNENTEVSIDFLKGQKPEVKIIAKGNGASAISVSKQAIMKNRSYEIKNQSSTVLDGITARFFGIHGMVFQSSNIMGNILTYYIFKVDAEDVYVTNSTCSCGADFCNTQIKCFEGNLRAPGNELRYTLTAVCLAFAVVSVIITALFLDELEKKEKKVSLSLDNLMASCKIFKNWNFVLLIPMTLYVGVLNGFTMGDYTQAFIGCAWGIQNIALVLTVFSINLALSSSICGWLVKYLGRLPIFLFTASLNVIAGVLLLCWQPDGEKPTMIFVVGGLLGFVLGTYSSQSRALYGVLFKEEGGAAFGGYQFWFCAGAALSYSYSKYLCTAIKIYLLLIISTLAFLGYLVVEISYLKSKRRNR